MIMKIGYSDFERAFNDIRPGQFSTDALAVLYEHFTQTEEDTGEAIELDVIAICCEWAEIEDGEEFEALPGHIKEECLKVPGGSWLVSE